MDTSDLVIKHKKHIYDHTYDDYDRYDDELYPLYREMTNYIDKRGFTILANQRYSDFFTYFINRLNRQKADRDAHQKIREDVVKNPEILELETELAKSSILFSQHNLKADRGEATASDT